MEFTKCLCILVLMYFSLAKKDGIQPCVAYEIKTVLAEKIVNLKSNLWRYNEGRYNQNGMALLV
jgi:hypothetical protein